MVSGYWTEQCRRVFSSLWKVAGDLAGLGVKRLVGIRGALKWVSVRIQGAEDSPLLGLEHSAALQEVMVAVALGRVEGSAGARVGGSGPNLSHLCIQSRF